MAFAGLAASALVMAAVLLANVYLATGTLAPTPFQIAATAVPLAANLVLIFAGIPQRSEEPRD